MASDDQVAAAEYLAANSRWYIKRTTAKAVILNCSDPNIRIRVGPRTIWRQSRLVSRNTSEWINMAQLKLSTAEMAKRAKRATTDV